MLLALSSKSAFALSVVPMCGENAETVIAPPISRAAPEIPLVAGNCEHKTDTRLETRGPRQAPPDLPSVELVPRVPPLRFWLPRAPSSRAPLADYRDEERSAHRAAIERPPR
ncbi:MAG: hypothetical protein ACOY0T_09060 [Myxococcota bacterium]